MFKCNTYIINPDYLKLGWNDEDETVKEVFIPITDEAAIRKIKDKIDSKYVYGAISLKYDDEILFDISDEDDVNWRWDYLLGMIEDFLTDGEAHFYLPTKKVSIKKVNEESLSFKCGERNIVLPTKAFVEFLSAQVKLFFKSYSKVFEEQKDEYMRIEKRVQKVMNAIR